MLAPRPLDMVLEIRIPHPHLCSSCHRPESSQVSEKFLFLLMANAVSRLTVEALGRTSLQGAQC